MLAGLAVTVALFVALRPVEGVQRYVVAPLAVKPEPEPPVHIVAAEGVTVTVGVAPTVTTTVFVLEQLPEVPVTV